MLSFSLVAEALTGLIYHRPSGENSNFQSELCPFQINEIGAKMSEVKIRPTLTNFVCLPATGKLQHNHCPGFKSERIRSPYRILSGGLIAINLRFSCLYQNVFSGGLL